MPIGSRLRVTGLACLLTCLLTACGEAGRSGLSSPDARACPLPDPGPAAGQTLARLGAYYFDGWSGPLSNFHFDGLVRESPFGSFRDREPLTGSREVWSARAVSQTKR